MRACSCNASRSVGGVSCAGKCRYRNVDVAVLNIPDMKFNPVGSRGIGEISIIGAAAAVAIAIYNASGKRVREYPITTDKIMLA
jgi:xanthine dehydrogenase YagR molybdenum-binding subunit